MSETIKVSKETKEGLLRVAAEMQSRTGRRIDLDEAIKHLLQSGRMKRPDVLASMFGIAPLVTVEDLLKEREIDERRSKRKYDI